MKRALFVLLLFTAGIAAQDPAPTLVVRGGKLFDPLRGETRSLGQLWIVDTKVLGERPADTAIPPGVRVLDAKDATVLPGLFDLHAHVGVHGGGFTLQARITPEENLETALLCGVTNVVDLHADQSTIFALRDRSRTDPRLARLWSAGAAFTVPKGHPTQFGIPSNEITSLDDVHSRFNALLPLKPDVIKLVFEHGDWGGLPVMPTLSDELGRAVVSKAHEHRLRAWSHVWSLAEAKSAVAAGADALAHGVFLGKVDAELQDAMVLAKTGYIPTLSVVLAPVRALQKRPPYAHDLVREVLHPDLAAFLNDPDPSVTLAASPAARFARKGEPSFLENLKTLADAHVPIGLGTDAGNAFVPHGPAVLFELELYVAAGLSPGESLRAATLGSANLLGVGDRFGSLAPGKEADIVIVRGDPTLSIGDVWQLWDVVKGGAVLDRAAARRRNAERARPTEVVRVSDAATQPAFGYGGSFEISTDQLARGHSTCALRANEDRVVCFDGEIRQGCPYGPWAGASVFWHPERKKLIDASGLTGLRFELSGTSRPLTLTVHAAAVKDFNVFVATLDPKAEAQIIDVPFSSLHQIGYGKPVAWTGKDITGIALEYRCPPMGEVKAGKVELDVKSIRFY